MLSLVPLHCSPLLVPKRGLPWSVVLGVVCSSHGWQQDGHQQVLALLQFFLLDIKDPDLF